MFLWPRTTPGRVSTSMSQDRLALLLGEVADLGLREGDVVEVALAQLGQAGLDLASREPVVVAVPAVELDREFAHRRVAARGDVGQDRLDRLADLPVRGDDLGLVLSALEPVFHRFPPWHVPGGIQAPCIRMQRRLLILTLGGGRHLRCGRRADLRTTSSPGTTSCTGLLSPPAIPCSASLNDPLGHALHRLREGRQFERRPGRQADIVEADDGHVAPDLQPELRRGRLHDRKGSMVVRAEHRVGPVPFREQDPGRCLRGREVIMTRRRAARGWCRLPPRPRGNLAPAPDWWTNPRGRRHRRSARGRPQSGRSRRSGHRIRSARSRWIPRSVSVRRFNSTTGTRAWAHSSAKRDVIRVEARTTAATWNRSTSSRIGSGSPSGPGVNKSTR